MPAFSPESLARWSGGQWTRQPVGPLLGVGHDTRTLSAPCLYAALKGARCDGHDYVGTAFERGAAAALVDRTWADTAAGARHAAQPLLLVADTGRALADLAAGYRNQQDPFMVGVTGSMGKTTVKDMLADMLARVRETARTPGNWNNAVGLPLSLLAMSETARAGVFELGINHPGEMAPLCATLRPCAGIVTNIAPVHIEFFDHVDAIAREKGELLRRLPADGMAVLNRDDAHFDRLRAMAPGRVTTVSMAGDADYRCVAADATRGEAALVDRADGETYRFRLRIPGAHAAINAATAAAMARAMDVTWPDILAALEAYTPLPMRWETVEAGGVLLINDAYNANPASMRAAVQTFAELDATRGRWLVLGDMLELGAGAETEHRELGVWLTQWPWQGLIVVGDLGALVADGALEAGFDAARVFRCKAASDAAQTMAARIKPGDAALLKASRGLCLEDAVGMWMTPLT